MDEYPINVKNIDHIIILTQELVSFKVSSGYNAYSYWLTEVRYTLAEQLYSWLQIQSVSLLRSFVHIIITMAFKVYGLI